MSSVQKQRGIQRNTGFTQGTHTVVLGTFRKSQKLIPSKKNQFVQIAKISSRKTQKITNPQTLHGWDSYKKVTRMLVLIVSPRGVNCRFWSHFECLEWKVNLLIQVSLRAVTCIKKFTKNTVMSIYFRFSFRAQYTLIGWSPLGFNFHFFDEHPDHFFIPLEHWGLGKRLDTFAKQYCCNLWFHMEPLVMVQRHALFKKTHMSPVNHHQKKF